MRGYARWVDARLCPVESGPVAGVAILLDMTDPLNEVQHGRLRGVLDRWIDAAEANTLIAVGAVRADAEERGEDFALCKPLEGADVNELYRNPRFIEERYKQRFLEPFEEMVDDMLAGPTADRSPIMESLQALLVETPGFADATYPRHVVVVSDLLQHSDAFSFYRGGDWRRFEGSSHVRRLAGLLKGVDVTICCVPRIGTGVDMNLVEDFWVNYFERAGVNSIFGNECVLGDL